MSDNTIIQSGYFTSTGTDHYIPLISGADWVKVYNWTNSIATAQWAGVSWYWQSGMAQDDGLVKYHAAATSALNLVSCGTGYNFTIMRGISYYDTSLQVLGVSRATTAATNVVSPVISAANTSGVNVGTIVRITNTAMPDVNGLDFTVGAVNPGVTFTMSAVLANAPGGAGGAGFYRIVAPNLAAYKLMYPSRRVIANITQAANAVVTTLVDHGYQIGQQIRFNISAIQGMTQINGLLGTILTAPTANTFSVNIDTTGFTAFTYPTVAQAATAINFAECLPVGDASTFGFTTLTGATTNQATSGILLGTGVGGVGLGSPGGTANDVIYWMAGKNFATLVNV